MNKKILIIDDDPDIVLAMKIILENQSYDVIFAYNGDDGLALAAKEVPDLIILDVMMRTRDEGFQIAYKLKNNPLLAHIPILISSAVNKATNLRFSPETDEYWLPVDEMVEKPVHPDDLVRRINNLLAKRKNQSVQG